MKLHQNKELFSDAVLAASQRFNIPEIYIEKDYWVTVALYEIFHSEIASQAVFKGGTALSKCLKLIDRFSEDIDIVVLKNEGETDTQLKKKLKTITEKVSQVMPEIQLEGITNKMGQIRKTAHQYAKHGFNGKYGQVREQIILEATWLGNFEPYTVREVSSYLTDLMKTTNQQALIEQYTMQPFKVQVLSKERTLCEKIMSLVRFSTTPEPYTDLSNKIRHVYDIHMMLKNQEVAAFFESKAFNEMLLRVGQDDVISFKNNNTWVASHPSSALIFTQPYETWDKIKNTYRTTFKELVLGDLPEESDLVTTLRTVAERLKTIDWVI